MGMGGRKLLGHRCKAEADDYDDEKSLEDNGV